MKFSAIASALALVSSVFAAPAVKRDDTSSSTNKTILLTNDDGWAATNIRAAYRELKSAGYNVVMVAPVSQRSGFGGQFAVPTSVNLTQDGGFGYPAKGAPSWGYDEDDQNIWYFNGTPASCVAFAVDYLFPTFFDNTTVDLVVAGPNEGGNLSPGYYTLSGTIGATYSAVNRGYPAIAFSGTNGNNSFYQDDVARESDDKFTPNILAKKVVQLVDAVFNSSANHPNLLPVTTGLNVNFPNVGDQDESCLDPEYVFTRLSGEDSVAPDLAYNATTGLFAFANKAVPAISKCIFGNCDLPSEQWVIDSTKCKIAVSAFSVDYDASYQQASTIQTYLAPIL